MTSRRSLLRAGILAALLLGGVALVAKAAQSYDYVTEEEEDLIRDAQDLQVRAPLFIKFLDNRIVALGLRERTAKEREQTRKELEDYNGRLKELARLKVKDAEVKAKPVNPDVYLRDYTRSELLRGYMQIIDELMDNIDDAYDRHLEVRGPVEALEKFLKEQMPRLKSFEPKTDNETAALKAVIPHSEMAIQDCEDALKRLPKTEKKPL